MNDKRLFFEISDLINTTCEEEEKGFNENCSGDVFNKKLQYNHFIYEDSCTIINSILEKNLSLVEDAY